MSVDDVAMLGLALAAAPRLAVIHTDGYGNRLEVSSIGTRDGEPVAVCACGVTIGLASADVADFTIEIPLARWSPA